MTTTTSIGSNEACGNPVDRRRVGASLVACSHGGSAASRGRLGHADELEGKVSVAVAVDGVGQGLPRGAFGRLCRNFDRRRVSPSQARAATSSDPPRATYNKRGRAVVASATARPLDAHRATQPKSFPASLSHRPLAYCQQHARRRWRQPVAREGTSWVTNRSGRRYARAPATRVDQKGCDYYTRSRRFSRRLDDDFGIRARR